MKPQDPCQEIAVEKPESLYDVMNSIPGGEFEFEPPRLGDMGFLPVDFGEDFCEEPAEMAGTPKTAR